MPHTRPGCSGPVQQHTHILNVPCRLSTKEQEYTRNLGWRKIYWCPPPPSGQGSETPQQDGSSPTEQTVDKQGLLSPTSSAWEAANHGVTARRAAPPQLTHPFQPSPGQGVPKGPSPSSQRVAAEMWVSGRWFPQRLSEQCCWGWRWRWMCHGAEEKAEHTSHRTSSHGAAAP